MHKVTVKLDVSVKPPAISDEDLHNYIVGALQNLNIADAPVVHDGQGCIAHIRVAEVEWVQVYAES